MIYISECTYHKSGHSRKILQILPAVFCPSCAKASLPPRYMSNQKEGLGFGIFLFFFLKHIVCIQPIAHF